MLCLCQIRDTPQVCWLALATMCLTAIEKLGNQPKYGVAIHRTIVQKHRSDPRCSPIPMRAMPAAIYIPSTLPKHPVMWMSPQGSSGELALLQSIRDQHGVHSLSVPEQIVSHSRLSFLTTSWSSGALQFGSYAVRHSGEHCGLQSRWPASKSSEPNTVHRHRAFHHSIIHWILRPTRKQPHCPMTPVMEWMELWHCSNLKFESNSRIQYNDSAHAIFYLGPMRLIKYPKLHDQCESRP